MSLEPRQYLTLAEYLFSDQCRHVNRETCCRNCVSRAYYAAVLFARDYASGNANFSPSKDRFHQDVRTWYKSQSKQRVATLLMTLQTHRNLCDYEKNVDQLEKIASEAIRSAHEIIRLVPLDVV